MFDQPAVKLCFSFDAEKLADDLCRVRSEEWLSHYRSDEYEGEWAIAPLRSVAGHPAVVHAVPGARNDGFFKNTPLLERCPYFKLVIEKFECSVGAVRLMRLGPGAKILEHSDDMGDGDTQELRIHVPVQTNPDVRFWVNNQLVPMQTGETWYADFGLPHRVENNGDTDRVHLVLDCEPNDWLLGQIKKVSEITRITSFLNQIGIRCSTEALHGNTFLPGVDIRNGDIVMDPALLLHPGDILHEAGHLAVTSASERSQLNGNVGEHESNALGQEIAAILWSYAALKAIGFSEEVVFHEQGYKGQSDWHIGNFRAGNYIGLPLLEWMGLCAGAEKATVMGVEPFPKMLKWVRE
jgi:quercetin dioxygenase-like cupin family protein